VRGQETRSGIGRFTTQAPSWWSRPADGGHPRREPVPTEQFGPMGEVADQAQLRPLASPNQPGHGPGRGTGVGTRDQRTVSQDI
jgi:hypothetical protein